MDELHQHSFRCTVEVCGRGTYVGAGKQLTQFPTRAELIAETAKRRKKRDDAIALMRRRPRDSHEGEMR